MRKRNGWLVWLLAAGVALTPARVRAQMNEVPPPDPNYPVPLNNHMEEGGPYVAGEFLYWRMNRLVGSQPIAVRGILDTDGSITGFPGTFFGSRQVALRADDLGPSTYQPGFRVSAGWLFKDGWAVELNWIGLMEAKYFGFAGPIGPGAQVGFHLEDSFLTSFVYNFPPDFAGPSQKVNLGNPGATFGIWDASTTQEIQFIQRFDQFELRARIPFAGMGVPDDCVRFYGLLGPRLTWIWEKFWWRTVAFDVNTGQAGQDDVAIYSNVLSQRFYGVHLGGGWDWYRGNTPIGGWALSMELEAALYVDVAKEIAKYERGDLAIASKRARTVYTFSPEVQGKLNLWWYPTEAIQVRIGYDLMAFFNTFGSRDPVSFNYGALDPPWPDHYVRWLDGFEAGIGLAW